MAEHTLALIKSHVARDHVVVNRIMEVLWENDFVIRRLRMGWLSPREIIDFYVEHISRPYFNDLFYSVRRRVIVMVLERDTDAISEWRRMLGATDPKKAADGTLRAAFGSLDLMANNVAHGSDSHDAARREIKVLFPDWVD